MDQVGQRIAELSPAKRELLRQLAERQRMGRARITAKPRPERIPLGFGQYRLWLLDRLTPGLSAYNSPLGLWLTGALDRRALRAALQCLLDRHEALRTIFRAYEGTPHQTVLGSAVLPWRECVAEGANDSQRRLAAYALAREDAARPFDLAQGPLMRATLIGCGDDAHLLLLCFHHIAIDGWSIGRLVEELGTAYGALRDGIAPQFAPLPLQMPDVAIWQHETFGDDKLAPQLDWWREQLQGAPATLDLPADRGRPAVQEFHGANWHGEVPAALYQRVEQYARERQVTASTVFLAAFQALLARYTGQDDIVVLMGAAGRTRLELEPVVGFFVTSLPHRSRFDEATDFDALVRRVHDGVLGAMEHGDAPLDRILETLRLPRSASHTPLAQVMFFFQNFPSPEPQLAGLRVTQAPLQDVAPPTSQCDLSLFVGQQHPRELFFQYDTALFDRERIARMAGHLLTLLQAAISAPQASIASLPLLSAEEREELTRWNATQRELPSQPTLATLLQVQAQRTPDAIALQAGERSISYRELDQRGNALAQRLRGAGVVPGSLVGLYVERAPEMLVALLGVLKAGGAYVPLDPAFPRERLAYMVECGGARVIVTQDKLVASLPAPVESVVRVDASTPWDSDAALVPPPGGAGPDDLAYVLFTSGSTGKPKGVEIRQRSAVNLLRSVAREPGLSAHDTVLAISTLSFDIALFELILPLTVGARIVLVDSDTVRDGARLRKLVDAAPLTMMQATPATWRMLLELGWRGKAGLRMVSTGEALPRELAQRLLPCGAELWNLYGPTETTVYSTLCRVEPGEGAILVGRPVDNTQIHIVDRGMQPLPVGVVGELLIGGDGVAAGYRARPDLTAEKFIADPFSTTPGARLYRTGDLARWRRDGSIEVLGRIDHQIKLRGFRIELGEIEAVLAQHAAVAQAVVHCREDSPGEPRLVAYVTAAGAAPAIDTLRAHLKAGLPDYMVPSAFVVLEQFPLTPNGKVDRRALPAPEQSGGGEADERAPATPEETTLIALWQQLLPGRRITVRDDFFALGGHSLLAAQLLARMEQSFGVELPLRALFEAPVLEQLATRVAAAREGLVPDDLESVLAQLEHLSDEEATRQLSALRPQQGGNVHG